MVMTSSGQILRQSGHSVVVQTTLTTLLGFPFREVPTLKLNGMLYLKQL